MTENGLTVSHLFVATATSEINMTHSTLSSFSDVKFYFRCALLAIGVVGIISNALILYALVASKQHKKLVLVVNQNALDLFSCFFLVITSAVKLWDIQMSGALGYWLCITIHSEVLIAWGQNGSIVSIVVITVDRYLKVVHHAWSKKWLFPCVIYLLVAFTWFVAILSSTPLLFETTAVIDGVCYAFALYKNEETKLAVYIWFTLSFYYIPLFIFAFCYGRILTVVRRQVQVMASHNAFESSSAQNQTLSHQIQSNIIKTMILVAAFFAICWLPHVALGTYFYLMAPKLTSETMQTIITLDQMTKIISFLYNTMNPFIYATKFDPVRKILKEMISSCRSLASNLRIMHVQ